MGQLAGSRSHLPGVPAGGAYPARRVSEAGLRCPPAAFRKLDAVAVFTARLLPAPNGHRAGIVGVILVHVPGGQQADPCAELRLHIQHPLTG